MKENLNEATRKVEAYYCKRENFGDFVMEKMLADRFIMEHPEAMIKGFVVYVRSLIMMNKEKINLTPSEWNQVDFRYLADAFLHPDSDIDTYPTTSQWLFYERLGL